MGEKGILLAGIVLSNIILGFGVLNLAVLNLLGMPFVIIGLVALVPSYYFMRLPAWSSGINGLNPVPMVLACAHEKQRRRDI